MLDLAKFVDKGVSVKLTGGRQGVLPFSRSLYLHKNYFSFKSAEERYGKQTMKDLQVKLVNSEK